jgi:hypothetical protein
MSANILALLITLSLQSQSVDFQRDIRPILASNCVHCHGPDEGARQADLRLDTQAAAYADRGGYAAITAGDPSKSEAYRRIISTDPDERMPPPDSEKSLSGAEVNLIRRWIEEGGVWGEHWAFVAPQRPKLPDVSREDWVRTPVDAFILARLEAEGLQPSPDADRETLLRRLSLDLIGLPPQLQELDTFLQNQHKESYTEQVERLLESAHYGERWGRIWLDAARYADSDGFEKDKPRNVWMYRDWVIAAINQDLPYDEFIVQQIAGDLLPNPTQDKIVATGFLRNSMLNEEGGIDPEQFRMEAMFDRMDAVGKAILGLTIQCAQCHNHKYDPLTQTDYYRMFALLNNSYESTKSVYTNSALSQRLQITARIGEIETRMRSENAAWKDSLNTWAESARDRQPDWTVLELRHAGDNSQRYYQQPDDSILAQGYAPTKYSAVFTAETDLDEIRAFRFEALTDPRLPVRGPGRSVDGLFALTEFKVEVASSAQPDQKQWVKFTRAFTDFANEDQRLAARFADKEGKTGLTGGVDYAIDGSDETAWGIDAGPGRRNQSRQAIFVADRMLETPGGAKLTFHLVQKHGGWNSDDNQNMNLGRFRLSATADDDILAEDVFPPDLVTLLHRPSQSWSDDDWNSAFSYWRSHLPQWHQSNLEIESLWKQHPAGTTQLVLAERPNMRSTHRLDRGDFLQPAERVDSGTPSFLHSLDKPGAVDRLDFARWLVDRRSPTTARAMINRIWQAYFGTGFVATSEDFGMQGEAPSHPQLLDWLAVEFMEHGWSLKHIHRLIVRSHTYQLSSRVSPEMLVRDPNNRLLARGSRFRVDAEVVRDITLSASGLLNSTVGGPSVYPPAPDFLFLPPASYGPKQWGPAEIHDRYRRALYTFRYRSVPYPVLEVFDAPNGDTSCVRRTRSNTPLQALATLNEPLFVECAQALAGALLSREATEQERLVDAFRRCLARRPTFNEAQVLTDLLHTARQQLADVSDKDVAALAAAEPALPNNAKTLERAAWTSVCRVILNLDETFTRE